MHIILILIGYNIFFVVDINLALLSTNLQDLFIQSIQSVGIDAESLQNLLEVIGYNPNKYVTITYSYWTSIIAFCLFFI